MTITEKSRVVIDTTKLFLKIRSLDNFLNYFTTVHNLQSLIRDYVFYKVCLVFRKKDLYLNITQKLTFHEIRRISYGFPMDFMGEICQISWVKSAGFQGWNPPDFERQLAGMVSPMFSEIANLCRVNRNDLQSSSWCWHDVMTLWHHIHGDRCLQTIISD